MFGKSKEEKKLNKRIEELEYDVDKANERLQQSKNELADVKHEKKISEEDIKHMVKMTQEKHEIEFQKKVMKDDRKKETASLAGMLSGIGYGAPGQVGLGQAANSSQFALAAMGARAQIQGIREELQQEVDGWLNDI